MDIEQDLKQNLEKIKRERDISTLSHSVLSDGEIKEALKCEEIIIDALDKRFDRSEQISGSSIDLRLGTKIRKIVPCDEIEAGNKVDEEKYTVNLHVEDGVITIPPNNIVLVNTMERVMLPAHICGFITGRSSVARLGLMVQCCQDHIVPGHIQPIPLQLVNLSPNTIKIHIGERICQLVLFRMAVPSDTPYYAKEDAKYIGEGEDPYASKLSSDSGKDRSSNDKMKPRFAEKFKRLVRKHKGYIITILISIYILDFIKKVNNMTVGDIWNIVINYIVNAPMYFLVLVVLVGVLIWANWGNKSEE